MRWQRPSVKKSQKVQLSGLVLSVLVMTALIFSGCGSRSVLPADEAAQRLLTTEVGRAIDEEIADDIGNTHYDAQSADNLYCVHKQTHLRDPDIKSTLIFYGKVLCAESMPGAAQSNEQTKDLSNLITLPIRIEVGTNANRFDNNFEVLEWQFPGGLATYTEDVARIFPPKVLPEINETEMEIELFDRLREKADAENRAAE